MVRQKSVILSCVKHRVLNNGTISHAALLINETENVINNGLDQLLKEINENEAYAFIDSKITNVPGNKKHEERVIITVFYRETPTRKVLVEKIE